MYLRRSGMKYILFEVFQPVLVYCSLCKSDIGSFANGRFLKYVCFKSSERMPVLYEGAVHVICRTQVQFHMLEISNTNYYMTV